MKVTGEMIKEMIQEIHTDPSPTGQLVASYLRAMENIDNGTVNTPKDILGAILFEHFGMQVDIIPGENENKLFNFTPLYEGRVDRREDIYANYVQSFINQTGEYKLGKEVDIEANLFWPGEGEEANQFNFTLPIFRLYHDAEYREAYMQNTDIPFGIFRIVIEGLFSKAQPYLEEK